MIEKTDETRQAQIAQYYEQCNNAYRDAWGMDKNMQLNLGLWKKNTKKLSQALFNLNEELAVLGKLNKQQLILDAGCGVGGTAIQLAKNYGCKVIGITISQIQHEQAVQNAKMEKVDHLCRFHHMDYMNTTFDSASFDVVLGIESICYAEPKFAFLKEAHRLLKKGGQLLLAENLQAKKNLTKNEYDCLYSNAFNGCKVKSLDTEEQYAENMNTLGFSDFHCMDYTDLIRPSIKRLRRFYYAAWVYNKWHQLIGKPFTQTQTANTKMCYFLQSSLQKGLWKYGIIKAIK